MLPIATESDLGAIKVGAGLRAGDDGTLSVVSEAASGLSMIVTYGSPPTDSSIVNWSPTNLVTVYGPPNMPLMLTATNGATFIDHDPGLSEVIFVRLSSQGIGKAQIALGIDASDRMTSIVAAPFITPQDAIGQEVIKALSIARPVQCATLFYPPIIDTSWVLLQSLAYTRGAPSDGVTPCVVTVLVDYASAADAGVTTLQMSVTGGDAVFDNKTQSFASPISNHGGFGIATANLYCSAPEVSTIDISVSNASFPNDHARAYTSFVTPPRQGGLR
jgi:hypothetical protein